MGPKAVGFHGVAIQRHSHDAAVAEGADGAEDGVIAEEENGLINGGDGFAQTDAGGIADAEQFGRQDVVKTEGLDEVIAMQLGLVEQRGEFPRGFGNDRQVFDFSNDLVGGHLVTGLFGLRRSNLGRGTLSIFSEAFPG